MPTLQERRAIQLKNNPRLQKRLKSSQVVGGKPGGKITRMKVGSPPTLAVRG